MKRALGDWFAERGWKPLKFQRQVWQAMGEGRSGLLHATKRDLRQAVNCSL